jgi:hypothetical protein
MGTDVIQHKLDVLAEHCRVVNRDYAEIEKTTLDTVRLSASPGEGVTTGPELIARLRELASLGIQHAIFNMPNVQDIEPFQILRDEVVPAAAEIQAAGR